MQKAPWQRTVTLMMVTQFLAAVGFSTVFPFLPAYVEQLGSRSGTTVFWVSAVFSGQAFAMMIASPMRGAVSDRYGRKPMLIRALVGGAVLVFLMGLARSSEELFWLRVIQGLVTGVVSAASSMAASVTPRDRLGYSMGLMQTGQWAGIAIGPVLGGVLSYAVGIRYSFMVTAVLLLAGGLIVMLGVKEDFVPPANRQRGVGGMFRQWGAVLTAEGVSLTYILRFTAWLGRTTIMPFLPLFIASLTVRQDLAGLYTGLTIGVSSLAATYSGIVLGRLGDKVGHKRLLIVSALATALFYVPMTFATAVWQVVLFNTLIGFAVGGFCLPSARCWRVTPIRASRVLSTVSTTPSGPPRAPSRRFSLPPSSPRPAAAARPTTRSSSRSRRRCSSSQRCWAHGGYLAATPTAR